MKPQHLLAAAVALALAFAAAYLVLGPEEPSPARAAATATATAAAPAAPAAPDRAAAAPTKPATAPSPARPAAAAPTAPVAPLARTGGGPDAGRAAVAHTAPADEPRVGDSPSIAEDDDPDSPDAGRHYPINREGIRAAVQEKIPEIKDCYQSWLQANPKLSGSMKVAFTISGEDGGSGGEVSHVELQGGDMGHALMEGCVLNVFKDLRFERPADGETHVTYPLVFANDDDGPEH